MGDYTAIIFADDTYPGERGDSFVSIKSVSGLKDVFTNWRRDEAPHFAAALAYYTIFLIAPLLIIVIGTAAVFVSESQAQRGVMEQIGALVGKEGAHVIHTIIVNIKDRGHGASATLLGIVLLIVGATGVFAEVKADLNKIWKVKAV